MTWQSGVWKFNALVTSSKSRRGRNFIFVVWGAPGSRSALNQWDQGDEGDGGWELSDAVVEGGGKRVATEPECSGKTATLREVLQTRRTDGQELGSLGLSQVEAGATDLSESAEAAPWTEREGRVGRPAEAEIQE
jgi:hypothetical protein